MSGTIPLVTSLEQIYQGQELDQAQERYNALYTAFQDRYNGAKPDCWARSPGRVNLIGEHIDYEGYSVLPMAIKQDTIVAIRKGGDKIVVGHLNPSQYPTQSFSTDPKQSVDTKKHTWANYFVCAYKGVFEYLSSKGEEPPQFTGLQILVEGRVPLGSGLSSSSALVCAAALALCGLYGLCYPQTEVATFTASCEKYVGTESGGMDQAISLMGEMGKAKLIDFNPVKASDVPLPEAATFVVANSLTVSNKAETGEGRYNLRVVECRLAAIVLAISLGQSQADAKKIITLKEVEPLIQEKFAGPKGHVENGSTAAVEHFLHERPYNSDELEQVLASKLEDLFADNASQLSSVRFAKKAEGFKLRQRALHVFQEASRVPEFQRACKEGRDEVEVLTRLGQIMDESQASCRTLYECSCEELDALIRQAKTFGAYGSRLTGAGWGGCTVTLVHKEKAAALIKHLKETYFSQCVADGKVQQEDLDSVVFDSRPSSGGAVLKLQF